MEKAKKKMKFGVTFVAITVLLLLVSSMGNVYANATTTKAESLPDFLESYLQMQCAKANLVPAKIAEMRAIWIHQISLKQERIDSASGEGAYVVTSQASWMSTFIRPETFGGGVLYNQYLINGLIDTYFTEFYTPVSGSGASVVGRMSSSTSHGDVYIAAKLGPNGAGHIGNYFVVEVANDANASMEDWIRGFVGYAQVTRPNNYVYGQNLLIGPAPYTFSYVSVGATVMPPPNELDPYNDVMGDSVWSTLA